MKFRLLSFVAATLVITLFFRVESLWQGFSAQAVEQAKAEEKSTPPSSPSQALQQGAPQAAETRVASAQEAAALPADPFALTDAEIQLLQDLAARRTAIEERESELDQREALLEAAELRLEQQIVRMEGLRGEIESLLKQYDEEQEAKLKALVSIYEAMKPKEAAPILESLEMSILLDVLERMKERKIAPIMAKMDPRRAREITVALAERRELERPRE